MDYVRVRGILGMMYLEEITSMDADPIEKDFDRWTPPIPPSYEQCVAAPVAMKADYVVSPLEMAPLLDWDDEDDEY